ncbi:hypothetical protein PPL_02269 [Heterostelium album PN500]|uniref:E3 ubiquitin-protein ligase n=1 Tax=Heterostelium pallidum (strain ATCC 26659 / Pp 5 / PN500) TaxID=670386 RepID=D3B1U5_HETP5|nr:hypothetical protein PPL_02269 [Heterostelium album PN500]EFA85269.1 hypothetical protein PPL_02269 [Heterostelium album PN500]|eukprot:XP_020437378.1 hypothetical protein PPL_02269 [Heterostelium album PN500]
MDSDDFNNKKNDDYTLEGDENGFSFKAKIGTTSEENPFDYDAYMELLAKSLDKESLGNEANNPFFQQLKQAMATYSSLAGRLGYLTAGYGVKGFRFSNFTVSLKSIQSFDDIYYIFEKFLCSPKSMDQVYGKAAAKFPFCLKNCTQEFYVCEDCSSNPGAILCEGCFKKGKHIERGHTYTKQTAQGDSACDCGKIEAILPSGFCCDHATTEGESVYPIDLIEPELKKSIHLFMRYLIHFILNEIQVLIAAKGGEAALNKVARRLLDICQWLVEIFKQSYVIMYIFAEEMSFQSLDPRTFDHLKPTPLPFLELEALDDRDVLPPITKENPIGLVLKGVLADPDIMNIAKLLFDPLSNIVPFSTVYIGEILKVYPQLSSKTENIAALTWKALNSIPSVIPLITKSPSPSSNLIHIILSFYKTLLNKKDVFNLDDASDRESFNNYLAPHNDIVAISYFFGYSKEIVEWVYNNDWIFEEFLELFSIMQGLAPIKRLKTNSPQGSLPHLYSVLRLENIFHVAVGSLFETILKKLELPIVKYIPLILKYVKPSSINYFTFNNYQLPSNDLLSGKDSFSLHAPFARLIRNVLYMETNQTLLESKQLFNNDQLLFLFNTTLVPSVVKLQSVNGIWVLNQNVTEFVLMYKNSMYPMDVNNNQLLSVLLGSNYYLNLLISTSTSNYKSTKEYAYCLSDMLTCLIWVLQFRNNSNYEKCRKFAIQNLIANRNILLDELKLILVEDQIMREAEALSLINEIAFTTGKDKFLKLKPEYYPRFDYYFDDYIRGDSQVALKNLNENIKSANPTQFPEPAVLDRLTPQFEVINNHFNEPLLYDIVFSVLLQYSHPKFKLQSSVPALTFENSDYFIPKFGSKGLETCARHVLYILGMALRHFVTKKIYSLSDELQSSIVPTIKSLLAKDPSIKAEPLSILNILQVYQVETEDGVQLLNILDLVSDINKIIGDNHDLSLLVKFILKTIQEFNSVFTKYVKERQETTTTTTTVDQIDKEKKTEENMSNEDKMIEALKKRKEMNEKLQQQS